MRLAFTSIWIDDETIWLEMLDVRNCMAYTYGAAKALRIYEPLPQFYIALLKQLATLQPLTQS